MIDRTARLTVTLEAETWDRILNALADSGPYRVIAPLIQAIQQQCMQQAPTEPYTSPALRGNGEDTEVTTPGG